MATKEPAMRPTGEAIEAVLDRATGPRRQEALELLALHREVSGEEPVVWAGRILGFGEVTYAYESGHSGRMPLIAFAPGAARHTVYLATGFESLWPELLERIGPHKASKACLYLTRLSGVDRDILRTLIERSRDHALAAWGG